MTQRGGGKSKRQCPRHERVKRASGPVGKSVRENQRFDAIRCARREADSERTGERLGDDRERVGGKLQEQRGLELVVFRERWQTHRDRTKSGRRDRGESL